MAKYLDFENQEKGYEPFHISKESVKANIGRRIVFLRKEDVDAYRGYAFPRYGVLCDIRYSTVYLDNYERNFDKRDIVECGIKIEETT
jgi:hypothetical protein